jgi:hypothetical protein
VGITVALNQFFPSMLQDCFEYTDWNMFNDLSTQDSYINIEEYTSSVTGCIRKFVDDVVPTITIRTYSTPTKDHG